MSKTNSEDTLDSSQFDNLKLNLNQICQSITMHPPTPLWKRVPTQTHDGHLVSDFMMLIPGLKKTSDHEIHQTLEKICSVLRHYEDLILFADFNLNLNLLWVSVKPVLGSVLEVATAINETIPNAKLIGQGKMVNT